MPENAKFMWNELLTKDPEGAVAFYTSVLGWSAEEMDMGPGGTYTILKTGGENVGGIMKMDGVQFDGVPPHWMSYVSVTDVDAAVDRVTSAGGTVQAPPFDVPGVGRIAVIADPTGARLSLMTPAESG